MSDYDSDVEFEDEWEEVQVPEAPAAAAVPPAAGGGDITIYLTDEAAAADEQKEAADVTKKRRPTGRVYTKKDRQEALLVHRVHCLCLLGHALLHDTAAADGELQALLVSLLPLELLDVASAAASSEDPQAKDWLPKLLHWFHRTFSISAEPVTCGSNNNGRRGGSSSNRGGGAGELLGQLLGLSDGSVVQQLVACVEARAGSSQQLAILLVTLLRGVGFLTRSVWSLDALPFKPAAAEAVARGGSIRATTPAAGSSRQTSAAGRSSRSRGSTVSKAAAAAAAAAGGRDGVEEASAGAAAGVGSGTKRGKGGRGGKTAAAGRGAKGGQKRTRQDAQQQAAAAEGAAAEQQQGAVKRRKGDEEFERELAMAMEATAAAQAAANQQAGSKSPAAAAAGVARSMDGMSRPPLRAAAAAAAAAVAGIAAADHSVGSSKKQQHSLAALIEKGAPPAELKRAAAAAAAVPAGYLWQPKAGALAAPTVWAEVYVGGTADGRWLHVDCLLGCYDQPACVEAAVVRRQPLSYVVACQDGAPKDVTRRYAANYTVNLKWRDDSWWGSTMSALRSSAAHLPRQLAAQLAEAAADTSAAAAAAAAAAASGGAGGSGAPKSASKSTCRKKPQQQQQQQQQRKRRKAAAQPSADAANSDADSDVVITGDKAGPHAAAAAVVAAAANPSSAGGLSDAAVRAAREDAELSARAAQQASGPPTTVDGFKGHPLYVLARHITKYQALAPNAVTLGLHKGEAFYARKDVQELHTRERWEREGRQVRADELDKPAKVVKKRSLPAGGGGSGRSSTFRGGWGPWQRSGSVNSSMSRAESDSTQTPAPAAGAAAAAAQGGAAAETAAAAGGEEEGTSEEGSTQRLYGLWQTDEFVRQAKDGKVPRNERGNVEVPPFAKSLPLGTAWIDAPNMAPICRSLGIDYAPALVGFEVQGGRMVPRIRGVVVCEEHEQAVIELHIERERQRAAAEQDKQRREAQAAWRRLLQHMWTRLELQRKYGDNAATGGDPGAAAAAGSGGPDKPPAAAAAAGGSRRMQNVISALNAAAGDGILQQQQQPQSVNAAAGSPGLAAAAARQAGNKAGKTAARAGGGQAGRQHSRQLPPGVAAPREQQQQQDTGHDGADAGAQALAGLTGNQQAGSDQAHIQPDAQALPDLEGIEYEEF